MAYYVATNNLERRVYEHKKKLVEGFTKKYNVDRLVYFEELRTFPTYWNAKSSSRTGCVAERQSLSRP